jgi:hypothetical protein
LEPHPHPNGTPTEGEQHVFVRDRVAGTTTMIGDPGSYVSDLSPSISADGAYVGYGCRYCGVLTQYLVTEVATGDTVRADELPNGIQGDLVAGQDRKR